LVDKARCPDALHLTGTLKKIPLYSHAIIDIYTGREEIFYQNSAGM